MSIPGTITPVFTPLFETADQSTATAYPDGFDAGMAALLGQACQLTYAQYGTAGAPISLSELTLVPGVSCYRQLGAALEWTEAIGLGAVQPGSAGMATVPFGFAFTAQDAGGNAVFHVIAFRGTRSYSEWVSDASAIPAIFGLGSGAGFVHGGFYEVYNAGGSTPPAAGTLAAQVRTILGLIEGSSVPLYIAGHSLGAALAELCAADVGYNFKSGYFSALYEYSLASPQVAAGIATSFVTVGPSYFQDEFGQAVTGGAYRIVNAADLVPIVPFSITSASGYGIEFAATIPAANTLSYLVQTGDVGNNHACDLYAGFLDQLPETWSAAAEAVAPAKIAVPAIGPTDAAVPA
ncbi:MAG TPA: lipase family protein [Longimicrobium sp.]|nr:lipase family protein [Longimicrobium sp.]